MIFRILACLSSLSLVSTACAKSLGMNIQLAVKNINDVKKEFEKISLLANILIEENASEEDQSWTSPRTVDVPEYITGPDSFWANKGNCWGYEFPFQSALYDGKVLTVRQFTQGDNPQHYVSTVPLPITNSRQVFDPIQAGYRLSYISSGWLSNLITHSRYVASMEEGLLKLSWFYRYKDDLQVKSVLLDPSRSFIKVKETLLNKSFKTHRSILTTNYLLLMTEKIGNVYLPTQFLENINSYMGPRLGLCRITLTHWSTRPTSFLTDSLAQVGDIQWTGQQQFQLLAGGKWVRLPGLAEVRKKEDQEKATQETRQYVLLVTAVVAPLATIAWIIARIISAKKTKVID